MAVRISRLSLSLPTLVNPSLSLSTSSHSSPSPHRQAGAAAAGDNDDDEAVVSDVVSILREQHSKSRWGFLRTIYGPVGITATQAASITVRLRSNPRLALRFFRWSESAAICRHDLSSYAAAIHVLTRARLRRAAQSLISSAIAGAGGEERKPLEVAAALARTYRTCDSAPLVFDLLIRSCLQAKRIDQTVEIVRMLRSRGIFPAVGTCNELIRTVAKARGSEAGLDMYREVFGTTEGEIRVRPRARVSPNVQTFNALLLSFYREGSSEDAGEIHREMEKFGIDANGFTYSILMAGICEEGDVEEANELWQEMVKKGIKRDVMAYNTMIGGFCRTGEMERAEELFRGMVLAGIEPTCITYERLVGGYCSIGDVDSAMLLYGEMSRKGFGPEASIVDAVIRELCEGKRTVEGLRVLRDEMRRGGFSPSRASYMCLIKCFCRDRSVEEAFKLQAEMAGRGFEPNNEVYSAFLEAYQEQGDDENVQRLKDEMLEMGLQSGDGKGDFC